VFRGYFLSLFGDEFVAAGNIMIIICIGQLINIITGPVGHIIVMSGREKVIRNFTYQAVALNIVLFIVLGGYYGGVGAAVASFLSIFLFNFRCWYWVKNELEIVIRPKFTTIKIKETLL
jgi:O-antigen/teichoic acid export membrane protein